MDPRPRRIGHGVQCSVCTRLPVGEVYACSAWHLYCKNCHLGTPPNCQKCSTLGRVSERARSLDLEEKMRPVTYNCPNHENGCTLRDAWAELEKHSKICVFGSPGRNLNVCRYMGFGSCDYVGNSATPVATRTHLRDVHRMAFHEGSFAQLRQTGFSTAAAPCPGTCDVILNTIWEPTFLNVRETLGCGETFIVVSGINGGDRTAYWLCFCLGNRPLTMKCEVQFTINFDEIAFPLTWKAPVYGIHDFPDVMAALPLRIPLTTLTNMTVDGTLYATVNILVPGPPQLNGLLPRGPVVHLESLPRENAPQNHSRRGDGARAVFPRLVCHGCGISPIRGAHYKCLECMEEEFDLCGRCATNSRRVRPHNHTLVLVKDSQLWNYWLRKQQESRGHDAAEGRQVPVIPEYIPASSPRARDNAAVRQEDNQAAHVVRHYFKVLLPTGVFRYLNSEVLERELMRGIVNSTVAAAYSAALRAGNWIHGQGANRAPPVAVMPAEGAAGRVNNAAVPVGEVCVWYYGGRRRHDDNAQPNEERPPVGVAPRDAPPRDEPRRRVVGVPRHRRRSASRRSQWRQWRR